MFRADKIGKLLFEFRDARPLAEPAATQRLDNGLFFFMVDIRTGDRNRLLDGGGYTHFFFPNLTVSLLLARARDQIREPKRKRFLLLLCWPATKPRDAAILPQVRPELRIRVFLWHGPFLPGGAGRHSPFELAHIPAGDLNP